MTSQAGLAVFGATGGTGREVVRQALDAGMAVRVLARRPEALGIEHPALTVVAGDVLDPRRAREVVAPGDAVVSVLGIGHSRAATTVYSAGTRNVLDAMRAAGARRIVCVSTCGLEVTRGSGLGQRLFTRHVLQRLLSRPYADMRAMEGTVRASATDWTVVRAARLTNGPRKDRVRSGPSGTMRGMWSVSRADLAAYLLSILDQDDSYRQTLEVAY